VLAVENPCPTDRRAAARLCAGDREERSVAIAVATETITHAADLGCENVVLQLGQIDNSNADWDTLRRRFREGNLSADAGARARRDRDARGERVLDPLRHAVDSLLRVAETHAITLLVKPGWRVVDAASAKETLQLLREFQGAALAPIYDTAAAHLQELMGTAATELDQLLFQSSNVIYVADACGPIAGLAPQQGMIDFAPIFAQLAGRKQKAQLLFSPWRGLALDEALAAYITMRAKI